jgi:fumarylpyruvate hydrolase
MSRLPFVDGGHFEVRRILCIGRNYRAHTLEMGGTERDLPFHFTKSIPALLVANPTATMRYPVATSNLHHEVELVVALGASGVVGSAVGLDMTRRDLQQQAKDRRRPWSAGKDFDDSAICGPLSRGLHDRGAIWVDVDGERRQEAQLSQLIWPVPELLQQLAALMTLVDGDLVYTGTPAGVGAVERGQRMHAHIDGLTPIVVDVG